MVTRLKINGKDVQKVLGCNYKVAFRVIRAIKDALGKKEHQDLTIREFCDYKGYNYDEVISIL